MASVSLLYLDNEIEVIEIVDDVVVVVVCIYGDLLMIWGVIYVVFVW